MTPKLYNLWLEGVWLGPQKWFSASGQDFHQEELWSGIFVVKETQISVARSTGIYPTPSVYLLALGFKMAWIENGPLSAGSNTSSFSQEYHKKNHSVAPSLNYWRSLASASTSLVLLPPLNIYLHKGVNLCSWNNAAHVILYRYCFLAIMWN